MGLRHYLLLVVAVQLSAPFVALRRQERLLVAVAAVQLLAPRRLPVRLGPPQLLLFLLLLLRLFLLLLLFLSYGLGPLKTMLVCLLR